MAKYKIGYTQGVYDMFHVGHLRLINNAKKECDYLIVGINADALVQSYKHKVPIISEQDRAEIVRNIKAVDECVVVDTLDKLAILEQIKFDAIFIGDDWKDNSRWIETKQQLSEVGVDVVFLPYTQNVSSTMLREHESEKVTD